MNIISDFRKWRIYKSIGFGMSFREHRKISKMFGEEKEKQLTCKHEGWNFKQHGRCCFSCGMFMVDFGD